MVVRVERTLVMDVPPGDVWEFIADPAERAAAISVVDDFEVDGSSSTWHIELPIPLLDRTVTVETEDVEVDPPRYVRFVGRSRVMNVTGEHEVEPTDGGSRLRSLFVVEGRVPGVERFFKRNLDAELDNLENRLRDRFDQ